MAEQEVITTVITNARRKALCKITSGAVSSIPPITHVVFGDKGVDEDGAPLSPASHQTALNHEVGRYPIGKVTYPVSTTARYTVTIPRDDLVGIRISEAGLLDSDGVLCAIKTMFAKGKDSGVEFVFTFDDEF